jgi:ribosomal protein S18 acetylase RimI-like enzyme
VNGHRTPRSKTRKFDPCWYYNFIVFTISKEFLDFLDYAIDVGPVWVVAESVLVPLPGRDDNLLRYGEDEEDEEEDDDNKEKVSGSRPGTTHRTIQDPACSTTPEKCIVGFILAKVERSMLRSKNNHISGHITNLVVLKSRRRTGIGKRLIVHLRDRLRHSVHAKILSLHVRESNVEAIQLYSSLNFHETSRLNKYYRNGDNAIRMELFLLDEV